MDSIELPNPYIRNGPRSYSFRSTIQISIDWTFQKLPAIATIVAEVLTIQAYSPSNHHDYVIDLATADISRGFLNSRKFVIRNETYFFTIFCNDSESADVWADNLGHSSSYQFSNYYCLGKQIASGRHSKVYLAHPKDDDGITYVVKVNNRAAECNGFLDRSQFERDAHLQLTRREADVREKKIDQEEREFREFKFSLSINKIVTLCDSFGTPREDFLVFQYEDGETLSAAISKYGPLSEGEARIVMWDLLSAVHFMHEQGVVHRDVRASNVFYWNREGNMRAKLFDLSEARKIPDGISGEEPFRDNPGKGPYKALEILSGRYHGKPADVWSCGVLLYKMLSDSYPFQGESGQELRENIIDVTLRDTLFDDPIWSFVSREAILLIRQMLQHDPFKRPSALGARSHKWLSDENTFRQAQVSTMKGCRGKRLRSPIPQVPQRIQTPATSSRRETRSSSTCDPSVLPVTYDPHSTEEPLALIVTEPRVRRDQRLKGKPHKGTKGKGSASDGSSSVTSEDSSDKPNSETGTRVSRFLKKLKESRLSLVMAEITQTAKFGSYEKSVTTVIQKVTKLQAAVKTFVDRHGRKKRNASEGAETEDGQKKASPVLLIEAGPNVPLIKKYPDIKRRAEAFRDSGLAHRCNHLCSFRTCTRARLLARSDKLFESRLDLKYKRPAIPSEKMDDNIAGTTRLTSNAPDRAICSREQQRIGSASEIVPTTSCLDDEIFEWAMDTKLFSDVSLKQAPVDPLFFCMEPGSTDTVRCTGKKEKEVLLRTSSRWARPARPVPLRDEMYVGTYIMKTVVAAAHVGLSKFSESRPVAAKVLLRSPTAQLQLSIILPYRRKFRTTAIALTAMFRIISLKKGLCLTRRVARGQPLCAEWFTFLTRIRTRCHMRPLRARMPPQLLDDVFMDGVGWRKPRVEPPPNDQATPQRFWARQYEVKKGLVVNAWNILKDPKTYVSGFRHVLGLDKAGKKKKCQTKAKKKVVRPVGKIQRITADEWDNYNYALTMV